MTSLAFLVGVLPLAISSGAGAQSRIAIGTAVIGGMTTATLLAVFYVPLAFVLVARAAAALRRRRSSAAAATGIGYP
jgi:multidrug efflux pump